MTASIDLSTRFVLAEDAPYLKNMAVLWTVDPALAEMIESAEGHGSYRVEQSRSGLPTIAVMTPDGRTNFLHSKYEPVAEAKKLTESVDAAGAMAFYIYGFGLGYHVEAIFEHASAESLFVIFEPDLALLHVAFQSRDLSAMLKSKRLLFFTQLDKGELLTRLTPHSALMSVGVDRIVHPPSQRIAGEFHAQMQQWVDEFFELQPN